MERVTDVGAQPSAKAFYEGRLASLALVNQSGDLIANQAISRAVQDTQSGRSLAPFAIMGRGIFRYQSGLHIDVGSVSSLTGLAWGHDMNAGHLTLGDFLRSRQGQLQNP